MTREPIHPPSTSPFSALVVEPRDVDAVFFAATLTSVGFTVTLTDNLPDAKRLLNDVRPILLVTEIRLGPYNGLQLAFQSVGRHLTVIVTSTVPDPVLQRDAERAGATFVIKPVTAEELIAAICRTALRKPNPDGTAEPIRAPFERRRGDRRAIVSGSVSMDRRRMDRRQDVASLMTRAASLA